MLATALPPVLPAPVAPQAPAAPAGSGNGPESFARMLDAADARRQAQAQATADQAQDAQPAGKPEVERKDGSATATDTGTSNTTSTDTGRPDPLLADAVAAETLAAAAAAAAAPAADPSWPTDPALGTEAAALLAGLATLPQAPPTAAAGPAAAVFGARPGRQSLGEAVDDAAAADAPHLSADPLASAGTSARRAGGLTAPAGGADTGGPRDNFSQLVRQARSDAGTAEHAADSGKQPLQAVAEHGAETPATHGDSFAPGAALPAAAPTPGTVLGGGATLVGQARLAASPGSPEFAGQLGAQLTTFVREGVQHARLELHPVELGPVTVQIALDGTQARVNLAAEHAATRQALEQAMPALAGSLREAGLTLSGGGVFEQPRQPQPDGGAGASGGRDGSTGGNDRGPGAGTRAGGGPATAADAPLRRRGVVDLVA